VKETIYSQPSWWQNSGAGASKPERAFKDVITAIQHKDRPGLLRLTHPDDSRNMKNFDQQAGAFFQQFEVLEIVGVPKAYEFDGLAVFFPRFRTQQGIFSVPFVFAAEDDGSFGFLPRRSQKVTFNLVNDWFDSAVGPGKSQTPTYCTNDDIKRATHKVLLAPYQGPGAAEASQLFLRGASFDAPNDLADLAAKVKARIDHMKAALGRGGIDEFAKDLTPEGAVRLKEWFAAADEKERAAYKTAITEQQPFFLFDLKALVVVYTRSPGGEVHVMYFTFIDNTLVWTNSSHVTVADAVFKRGPLNSAASGEKPFSSIVNK